MFKFNRNLVGIIIRQNTLKRNVATENHTTPLPNRPPELKGVRLTDYKTLRNEFEFVKKLMPQQIVPDPPQHEAYPTPSGWIPVNVEKASKHPYAINRTRFHNLPIYIEEREGGTRKLIKIKYIEGDIWELDRDLKEFISQQLFRDTQKRLKIYTSVNEVQRQILVKGIYHDYVCKFCLEKGF